MTEPLAARIRAAHDAQTADIVDDGEPPIINPEPRDWASVKGRWDPTSTDYANAWHALMAEAIDMDYPL